MKIYNYIFYFIILLTFYSPFAIGQQKLLQGFVYDITTGLPLKDVKIQGNNQIVSTDIKGSFKIPMTQDTITLFFSSVGYLSKNQKVNVFDEIRIGLTQDNIYLDEVVINTGYQKISKERSAGSFVHVNQKQLESISGNTIIEKLDGILPGLYFDKRNYDYLTNDDNSILRVRGINTFSSSTANPLIIVDNFPFEGDLSTIHPEEVESVTMLRDATAASIWGARAGNGVIVITLKKNNLSAKPQINFSSTIQVTEKPYLMRIPEISSSEFVDVELYLFEKGHYNNAINGSSAFRTIFSPVVQALYDERNGRISTVELNQIISKSRNVEYKEDLYNRIYQNRIQNINHINLNQNFGKHEISVSGGFNDLIKGGTKNFNSKNQAFSVSLRHKYNITNKLSLQSYFRYSINNEATPDLLYYPINPGGTRSRMYPYLELFDDYGKPLVVPKDYNQAYKDTIGLGLLYDWSFNPIRDSETSKHFTKSNLFHPNLILNYNLKSGWDMEVTYTGEIGASGIGSNYNIESYYVRDLLNRYSQINNGKLIRAIPEGGILTRNNTSITANKLRVLGRINEEISPKIKLSGVLGWDLSDVNSTRSSSTIYGYDSYLMQSKPVDHISRFPLLIGGTGTIPNGQSFGRSTRRLVSFFGNAAFEYNNKYIINLSSRRDASNVFGAKSNELWNPLWSAGVAWNIHNENFLNEISAISFLKLRISQGHSGNLGGGTTSDRVVISYATSDSYTGLPFATVSSPPNTSLKWENVEMSNIGLDISLFSNRISGSLDYYKKSVSDLISDEELEGTIGFTNIKMNIGRLEGRGFDANFNFQIFQGFFKWNLGTSMSFVKDWVTHYKGTQAATTIYASNAERSIYPVVGRPLMSVYSYKFGGLDGQTGEPLGFKNGELSKDYANILRDSLHNLNYHGSATPLYHGFINNQFSYKSLSLFVNMTYRGGHYFTANSINYLNLYNSWTGHSDFSKRWQKPGDEKTTNVPSMIYPANTSKENFYAYSEANVHKADVLRLQRVALSYRFQSKFLNKHYVEVGLHINNIGLLWKAANVDTDPDYNIIPPSKNYSANIRFNF